VLRHIHGVLTGYSSEATAQVLFDEMQRVYGIAPTRHIYGLLMNVCVRCA
jgi:hypothetical protein